MSQLIKGISRTHQSVFKIPRLIDLAKYLELNLKELESVIGYLGSFLWYCYKPLVVPE